MSVVVRDYMTGIFRSQAIPGFWLRTMWLWEQPKPLQVARELGLI